MSFVLKNKYIFQLDVNPQCFLKYDFREEKNTQYHKAGVAVGYSELKPLDFT